MPYLGRDWAQELRAQGQPKSSVSEALSVFGLQRCSLKFEAPDEVFAPQALSWRLCSSSPTTSGVGDTPPPTCALQTEF